MQVSIKQAGVPDIFYVKKYLKKFNKWKEVSKNIVKYLNIGAIFIIVDDIKNECTGVVVAINEDNQNDGNKYCYIICYQIDSINIGKLQQQTIFTFLLKYGLDREYIISIPGDRYKIESERLIFGYANNYYIDKSAALKDPFMRSIYSSIAAKEEHISDTLIEFKKNYLKLKYHYHITPDKYIIDIVKKDVVLFHESKYNLIYLGLNEDGLYEIIGFWSLADKNREKEYNLNIFNDVRNFLKTLDRNFVFSSDAIRGDFKSYSKALNTINKYISKHKG